MPKGLGVQDDTATRRYKTASGAECPGSSGIGIADIFSAFEQAPGFLCLLRGPRHIVTLTNAAFLQLTGHRDPVGSLWANIPLAADQECSEGPDRIYAIAEPFVARRRPVAVQHTQDGATDIRFIDFTFQPILSSGGQVTSVLVQGTDVTDHVRSEAELRAAGERSEIILDLLGDGFVAFDKEFRIIKLNAAALQYDGRQEREIIGRTHWEAWPTSAGSFLEEAYRRCLREQMPVSVLRRYLGFGKDRWLEIRMCPVPGGIVSFYRDVTERKLSEEALRASEERFRALVEAVPHQVWEAGPNGRTEWCNGRFHDFTGATVEELTEGAWSRIIHPDDQGAAAVAWHRALEEGTVFEGEFRLLRASDQTYRWFLSKGVPMHDADGNVVRWIGTNTDIHDQKVAAYELAQLNAKLEERVAQRTRERDRMWRLSTDLMLVAYFDATIAATNPAWKTMLDWSSRELHDRSLGDFIHPDDRDDMQAAIDQLTQELTTCRFQTRLRHMDGSYRWIAWTAVPDDRFIHAVGRDVTVEKEAAQALAQAEEALRQSQKMEAVGQLTGGIAHDFNNLLTGVIGSLDLIQARIAQGRPEQVGRYIDAAMSSANRAAALTHRLLAFSRRQPLDPKPVHANALVASMDELLRRTTSEIIRVEFLPAEKLWLTLCDSNQLENALLNLVINARDAMPGGGTIRIETMNVELDEAYVAMQKDVTPGQYIALSVTDDGSGMTRDVIQKAFEPFFTTKPIGQGTGLGLSMVYGFVKQSGGHVRIQSEPGKGTTVRIYLPRFIGDAEPAHEPPTRIGETRARADETLLVVEDEAVVRNLIVEMLQELGYRVLEAADGPEGLRILQSKQPIDLLLTDVGLPGLNGRQLADAAREGRPDLKILFMTGYVESAMLENGFLGPGMEVIAKPFAFEVLAGKIETMIH